MFKNSIYARRLRRTFHVQEKKEKCIQLSSFEPEQIALGNVEGRTRVQYLTHTNDPSMLQAALFTELP